MSVFMSCGDQLTLCSVFLNSAGDLKLRAVRTHQLRQSVQVHQHLRPGGADLPKMKAVDAESREHAQLPRQEGPVGV